MSNVLPPQKGDVLVILEGGLVQSVSGAQFYLLFDWDVLEYDTYEAIVEMLSDLPGGEKFPIERVVQLDNDGILNAVLEDELLRPLHKLFNEVNGIVEEPVSDTEN